jgi:hypothetical protein
MDTRKLTANGRYIDDEGGALVAQVEVESIDNNPNPEAVAAELVRRYNAFPALVEALEGLVEAIEFQAEANFLNEDADEGEENALTQSRALLATLNP